MLSPRERELAPLAENWSALMSTVKRFEEAWRQGPRPRIDDYLPADDGLRRLVLIELAHIDLELRIKAGECARVEEYLARYRELEHDRTVALELIAAECELRQRREPELNPKEYFDRFPQYRAELPGQISQTTIVLPEGRLGSTGLRRHNPPAVAGYEIQNLLGQGGMGIVYKARQVSLDRPVALKFLPEACARDPVWLERFRLEARTASALNHPHICTIYDTGDSSGWPYLSMELVDGQTLEALVGQPRPVEELARLLGQAARALSAAHAAGVVHRDLKPANIMVREDGIVKVLDFGLARQLPGSAQRHSLPSGKNTDPGTRVGTLLYMSPEQARAEQVDTATDIFSLGLMLYEFATGQHPFHADSEISVLHAIVSHTPLAPSRLNPEVPAALDTLIQRMLAKDPRLRPTAVEVEAALDQLSAKIPQAPGRQRADIERPPTVGRQQESAALRTGFEQAAAGHGSLLCVTGEPGLGKTTLVESFLDELLTGNQPCNIARGRCSERLAGTEAYLPFLEALDSLLHGEIGTSAAQLMKLLAPTWYIQLAPLAADDPGLARVLAEARDVSQERRKRELGVFLHEMSRQCPLVVFLDDIHWADPSSVDLLAYLGNRCSQWSLLVVLTIRPSELLRSQHPFAQVKLELQGRSACREIALPFLSRDDFDGYLDLAFAGHRFPEELAATLHARTEGNPLFMVDLLRYLRDSGVIVQDQGHWVLARGVPDLRRELPESVRGMIQRKLDQLSTADRHLLMAASVQGPEFDSAVVAALLDCDAADVEERLDVLQRVHVVVRLIREQTFPDRTLTLRYGFVHVLYQNALYAALQPTRKATWCAAAARTLMSHYGEKSSGQAAELAMLFEAARDPERATDFYLTAAQNAARIFAHHEAVALALRGLALLESLPDTRERARRELPFQATLAIQLQVVQGYASPQAGRSYARARALCEELQDDPQLFLVLWGLWMFHEVRSDLDKSLELARRLFDVGQKCDDPARELQARMALMVTSLSLGQPAATREHSERGVAIYDPKQHSSHKHLYGQDPKAASLAFGAIALWLLGYPDQARERSRAAVALGAELGHPTSRALALYFDTTVSQYCRDVAAVQASAEATTAIATEHGLSLWLANGLVMRGWALAELGDYASGIAMLRQGLTDWVATGAETHRTYFLGLLAEALAKGGQIEECLDVIGEALVMMQGTGTVFHGAELHRLQGEFLLQQSPSDVAHRDAEGCFQRALAIAREQQAKSLELRAATSLSRLYQKLSRCSEARPVLADCYNWFTEGFDTPDLQEARALLDALK
jgi:serine/threonine protein kinase/predicted ATPase